MMKVAIWCAALIGAVGCTKRNPAYCESDLDCPLAATPFCDVAGEFEESGFLAHSCSERPAGCPLERCGCTVGTATCSGDQLVVCNSDGESETTSRCALGCSSSEPRCLSFAPSNGLQDALDEAAAEPDIIVPPGSVIDTTTGVVVAPGGATVTVRSEVVAQGTTMIRVFIGRSFVIHDATIEGTHAFAAVAEGPIVVKGRVDASANGRVAGPGALGGEAPCSGQFTIHEQCGSGNCAPGAGGAGNGTVGGKGGVIHEQVQRSGGAAQTSFAPLTGGCRGGNHRNTGGGVLNEGGAGGGAIQLVSRESVALIEFGLIDVGGGGGDATAGGGSGGTVVFESPVVRIIGPNAGVAANGGAGGGCFAIGPDAAPTSSPALGPTCSYRAGNGGTGAIAATDAHTCNGTCNVQQQPRGGGGGAVGRLRISTADGTFEESSGPLMSAVVTSTTLTPQ